MLTLSKQFLNGFFTVFGILLNNFFALKLAAMHSLATMMPYLTSRLNVATFCCINGVQALSTFIKNGHQTKLRLVYIHGKC